MKCTLEKDINRCPYYKEETGECMMEGKCSFQDEETKKSSSQHIREERWYEKYIK